MTLRELINQVTDNALENNCLDSSPQLDYALEIKIAGEYGSFDTFNVDQARVIENDGTIIIGD